MSEPNQVGTSDAQEEPVPGAGQPTPQRETTSSISGVYTVMNMIRHCCDERDDWGGVICGGRG